MSHVINYLEQGARILLFALAALLPAWFIPSSIGIELGRELTFALLILISALLWLITVLARGEVRLVRSPFWWFAGALVVAWGGATLFSRAPMLSALLSEATAEKWANLVMGLVMMFLVALLFRTKGTDESGGLIKREGAAFAFLLLISVAGLVGVVSFLQLLGVVGALPQIGSLYNAVGTVNGLSLFYGALFAMTLGMVLMKEKVASRSGSLLGSTFARYLFPAASIIFFLNIAGINFRTGWIVLLGTSVILFGLLFNRPHADKESGAPARFNWRHGVALAIMVFSALSLFARISLIPNVDLPAEVSPSLSATLDIAGSVYQEGVASTLLGSGPGTFGLDWSQYKDPSINQTIFWGVRFNQGSSLVSTAAATTGVLGLITLLGFFGAATFLFLRSFFATNTKVRGSGFAQALFLGFIFLLFSFFLYPGNYTHVLLLLLVMGMLFALLKEWRPEAGQGGGGGFWKHIFRADQWRVQEQNIRFVTSWSVFLSSLVVIFFLTVGLVVFSLEVNRFRAAVASTRGIESANEGAFDSAVEQLETAVRLDARNPRYAQGLAQVRIEKVRSLIQQAAAGQDVGQEFQQEVALAVESSQRMTRGFAFEPQVWRTQGALYELVIPFIQGSEQFSFDGYRRAVELDPLNPAIYVDWGRAGLSFVDRIQALISSAEDAERETLEQARVSMLQEIARIFQQAIAVKGDFASAHFLLAQTAIRLGDVASAIASVENAKQAAPFDLGIAFQLGLLYYQGDNLDAAQAEFERAVSINEDYSNARYFLGLIYDRKGETDRAVSEFERVAVLNPDNAEVQNILANIREGRSALESIVPPAEPPEDRTAVPVEE